MTQSRSRIAFIVFTAGLALTAASGASAQQVTDPTTGATVELADINFTTLDRSDTRNVVQQLADQGFTRRDARTAINTARTADFQAVTVVDPTTNATTTLASIDFSTLSRAEAREVAEQLADQGVSNRNARSAIRSERRADIGSVSVVDPSTGQTTPLSEVDRSNLSQEDRENIATQLADAGIEVPNRDGGGDRGPREGGDRGPGDGGDRGPRGGGEQGPRGGGRP